MFNCSSALFSVVCRQGIKEEEERETSVQKAREVSSSEESKPRRGEELGGKVRRGEEKRRKDSICLIGLEADGQTIRQTRSLT